MYYDLQGCDVSDLGGEEPNRNFVSLHVKMLNHEHWQA
jgi:hypothetical protein